jgi:hypothetical protein
MSRRSYWYDQAAALIVHLTKDLPAEATLAQRRKALRGNGYPAHQGTRWGRRKWGEAVRDYLSRHGYRKPQTKAALPLLSPLERAQKLHFTKGFGDVPPHPDSVRGER